jgi:hypothetical protein
VKYEALLWRKFQDMTPEQRALALVALRKGLGGLTKGNRLAVVEELGIKLFEVNGNRERAK